MKYSAKITCADPEPRDADETYHLEAFQHSTLVQQTDEWLSVHIIAGLSTGPFTGSWQVVPRFLAVDVRYLLL